MSPGPFICASCGREKPANQVVTRTTQQGATWVKMTVCLVCADVSAELGVSHAS